MLIYAEEYCSTFGLHKNTNTLKTTTKFKIVKGLIAFVLIVLMSQSFAQSRGSRFYRSAYGKSGFFNFGIELSLATPRFQLQSKIADLKGLSTRYFGGNIGAVFAGTRSKVKVTLGLFSSDGSVRYPIDLFQGGASWNLYLLQMKKPETHLFEPYLVLGANFVRSKFNGNYSIEDLNSSNNNSNPSNLGRAAWASANVGLGVEYELENDALKFIHFFMQAVYSAPAVALFSDKAFSQTTALGGVSYTFGINFAITK